MVRFVRLPALLVLVVCAGVLAPADGRAQQPDPVDRQVADLLLEPVLVDPTTVVVDRAHTKLHLDETKDYVVQVAPGAQLGRSVTVEGGHHVVIRDATLSYVRPKGSKQSWRCRGLYFKGQSGTLYVDGLTIRGPLLEGIDLDQRLGAQVVLKNVTIDPVHGTQSGHHADLLQTWAGPDSLVVDGFRGASDFQGIFLQPNDTWDGPPPRLVSLKNVRLDLRKGRYALYVDAGHPYPVTATDVEVQYNRKRPARGQWLWPKPSTSEHTWDTVVGK